MRSCAASETHPCRSCRKTSAGRCSTRVAVWPSRTAAQKRSLSMTRSYFASDTPPSRRSRNSLRKRSLKRTLWRATNPLDRSIAGSVSGEGYQVSLGAQSRQNLREPVSRSVGQGADGAAAGAGAHPCDRERFLDHGGEGAEREGLLERID